MERLRQEPDTSGVQKAFGLHRLLVVLEGKPSEQTRTQPSLGEGQHVQGARCCPSSCRPSPAHPGRGALGSHRAEGLCGHNPGLQVQQGLGQVLRQDRGGFHGVPSITPFILGRPLHVLEVNEANALVFCLRETLGSLVLPLGQLVEEVAHTLQSLCVAVEAEAQREAGVGGPQVRGDRPVDPASISAE